MQRLSLLSMMALLLGPAAVLAQPGDPVEALRQVLRAPSRDPGQRTQSLQAIVESIHGLADLRRAAALPDWRDEDIDPQVAGVDRQQRFILVQRFQQAVREALTQPVPATRVTVCDMLADLGVSARGVATQDSLARDFGLDLVRLMAQGDARVREAAARALGKIDADPSLALPALAALLRVQDPRLRAAAAGALIDIIRTATDLASNTHSASGVTLGRGQLIGIGTTLLPVSALGLRDPAVPVRRMCLEAIGRCAAALDRLLLEPPNFDETNEGDAARGQIAAEQTELLPLALALRDQGPALAQALADADAETRARDRRVLALVAEVRGRWLRRAQSIGLADDPLLDVLRPALPGLTAALADGDGQARQTTVNILETVGPAAAAAVPALIQALADPNQFVRWAAARALGKMGGAAAAAVPALAQRLDDGDLDLALAAAAALEQLGPEARVAVPALVQALRGNSAAEIRLAAIRALQAIGPAGASQAIPALAAALGDPEARVRFAAAVALGRFGPAAAAAAEALQRARSDRSPDVQQAAGAALLEIMQPSQQRRD
jgi:HEAT repeat protein